MEKKNNEEKNPNFLHWTGFAFLCFGYFMLLQLKLVEGFSLWFLGCGLGLLGCEYESVKEKLK